MKLSIITLSFLSLLIFSCGTSNKYIADDIYVLKPSDLPIGESSADETSYAAFKQRKDGPTKTDRQLYADQYAAANYRNCLSEPFWYNGCGCSYAFWTQRSPYSNQYGAMYHGYGYGYGYGYNPYYSSYYSPYYSPYGQYSSMGMMYGSSYYSNYNSPWYYGNGYGGYGYGGNGYGGNLNSNHGNNYHNGPRGSVSGYSNPNGRISHAGPVKSVVNNNSGYSHSSSSISTNNPPVRKAISTINTNPDVRSSGTVNSSKNTEVISRNPSSTTNSGRTYQKPNAPVRTSPSVIRNQGSDPIQRSNNGGTIQRSGNFNQGSGNSGGGTVKSSGGSSTPRTNTNTNTNPGRRP